MCACSKSREDGACEGQRGLLPSLAVGGTRKPGEIYVNFSGEDINAINLTDTPSEISESRHRTQLAASIDCFRQ